MLDLIKAYETYMTKVKHASANTVASYLRDIRQFADWLDVTSSVSLLAVGRLHIQEYLS